MLTVKREFESLAQRLGVSIKNYHADNGRFADKAFIKNAQHEG
jgi:hypothetical protein